LCAKEKIDIDRSIAKMSPTNQPSIGTVLPNLSLNLPTLNNNSVQTPSNQLDKNSTTITELGKQIGQTAKPGDVSLPSTRTLPSTTSFANGLFDLPPFMSTPFPNPEKDDSRLSAIPNHSSYSKASTNLGINSKTWTIPSVNEIKSGLDIFKPMPSYQEKLNDKPMTELLPSIASLKPSNLDDKKSIKRTLDLLSPLPLVNNSYITEPATSWSPATSMSLLSNFTRPRTEVGPIIQNVVSVVNLQCKLDLRKIATNTRNAEYNPKRFAAVILRIREPRTTSLVFASGKLVCTGAKSEDDSKLAARKYARIIQKLGFEVKFHGYKVHNIVGSVDVRFPIRLEAFNTIHSQFSSYEPELFPGLIYRMVSPRVVLLIFVSGKVVLTGAKERSQISKAFEIIHPILKEFQKIVKVEQKSKSDNLNQFKEMLKQL